MSKGIKTPATTFAPPRVHFSKFSQLFIIPYDDVESKWYTHEEQRHFYQACLSDIHRLRVMLRDAAPALKLSETSKRSSKWARKRAAKVAAIHASSFHY
jgi:hypothetical protein